MDDARMSDEHHVFEDRRDPEGFSWRAVRLRPDGHLVIEGHDLGERVEDVFGVREYEFERTVDAAGVQRLRDALGLAEPASLIAAIATGFNSSLALERFLDEHGVPSTFWNRIGD
jgi:hypothetical protein